MLNIFNLLKYIWISIFFYFCYDVKSPGKFESRMCVSFIFHMEMHQMELAVSIAHAHVVVDQVIK